MGQENSEQQQTIRHNHAQKVEKRFTLPPEDEHQRNHANRHLAKVVRIFDVTQAAQPIKPSAFAVRNRQQIRMLYVPDSNPGVFWDVRSSRAGLRNATQQIGVSVGGHEKANDQQHQDQNLQFLFRIAVQAYQEVSKDARNKTEKRIDRSARPALTNQHRQQDRERQPHHR